MMAQILIMGGTGSFGSAFVHKFHKKHRLTVMSRDEFKQYEARLEFPDVKYIIGDIRDRQRVFEVVKGYDYVLNAAALKQVPSCEFFPIEAVNTNVIGANNVIDAAKALGNKTKVICLSTDKAVYPINAMGMSKALMEKVAISKGAIITRYGNVMGSRGSIIPRWQKAAANNQELTLTDPRMTRFLLSLDDSIDLVMYAMENSQRGDIFVRKAPSCTMLTLAKAIGGNIKQIGIRHGEKLHETLISQEEMCRAQDRGDYFVIPADTRTLNYDAYFSEGDNSKQSAAYSSNTAHMLGIEEVQKLL